MADWTGSGGPIERSSPGDARAAPAGATPLLTSARTKARTHSRISTGLGTFFHALADRSFGSLFRIWLWVVLGAGLAYWILESAGVRSLVQLGNELRPGWEGLITSIYFSFVTATSVGFGDVVPVGCARALAITESIAGLLIFGCVVSKLVSQRQEMMLDELHRMTFEARLGRVRTNLYLVLSELQSIASASGEKRLSLDRLLSRAESAAMVFAGELTAVHDLLFRPQQMPDEAIFESILANLATGLKEFSDLVEKVPETTRESALLSSSLKSMSRLASEICGECVPREYAPALKLCMDKIQGLSRRLSAA
jgi:hypothetical protein